MKATGEYDPLFVGLAKTGVLRVDDDGSIWRQSVLTRSGKVKPIAPRRAEKLRSDGYLEVTSGRRARIMAHRLVYLVKRGPLQDGCEVNHEDGVRSNNRPGNLEPMTPAQNNAHAINVLGAQRGVRGERNGRAVLSNAQRVEVLRLANEGTPKRELARRFGVSPPAIRKILRNDFPEN